MTFRGLFGDFSCFAEGFRRLFHCSSPFWVEFCCFSDFKPQDFEKGCEQRLEELLKKSHGEIEAV